jgi:prepilin-type N-terminal cleavage/methylation domain-containing protein
MKSRRVFNLGNKTFANGFTLPEALIVIGIAAILMYMTATMSVRFYQNQQVDDTSRSLLEALRRARTYAVAARGDSAAGVKILSASSSIVVFRGSSYGLRDTTEDEVIDFSPIVTISGTSTEVVFSRLYGTSTVSETWTVSNQSVQQAVSINAAGTVEIQ